MNKDIINEIKKDIKDIYIHEVEDETHKTALSVLDMLAKNLTIEELNYMDLYTEENVLNFGFMLYEDENYRLDIRVDNHVGYSIWSKDHRHVADVDISSFEDKDIKILIDLIKKGVQKQKKKFKTLKIKKLYDQKADIKAHIADSVQINEFDSDLLYSWAAELGKIEWQIKGQEKALKEKEKEDEI